MIKKVKKINVIEINGQRYDAHTGAELGNPANPAASRTHKTRQAAKPAARHKQQRSTTLMRKAVKRPSFKQHHIKPQIHTDALIEQPATAVIPKLSFGAPDTRRLQRANHIKKSHLISHFNANQTNAYKVPVTVTKPVAAKPAPQPLPRQQAPDIDEIFERAIQQASSHLEPAPKTRKKRHLHLTRKHARA